MQSKEQNKKLSKKQRNNRLMGLIVVVLVIVGGVFLYDYVLGEPEAASGPLEAVPLTLNTPVAATEMPAGTTAPTEAAAPTESAGVVTLYEIDQSGSQVSFTLEEDLRGVRTVVVGTTNQVAGQIAVNLDDLTTAQVGVITINARTLLTDNNFRNNAIRNRILNTDQYEFITFTPTQIVGLPASAAMGEEIAFQIVGELTIRDITNPVTFDVTATAASPTQLVGTATATVTRAAYKLVIPSVPDVGNVTDEVQLTIDFVATAS
ncbi:MAG: YceI family protein [Candidatus Promineifilaceae bacterium]